MAEFRWHPLFSDNMVLQRGVAAAVYGQAEPGQEVELSFKAQSKTCLADAKGQWRLNLDPMSASMEPGTLQAKAAGTILKLKNVLVGDVWLCGGQSNMEMPIRGYSLLAPKLKGNYDSGIRLRIVLRELLDSPRQEPTFEPEFKAGWQEMGGEALQAASPAAYYFAAKLRRDLKIPIGLLHSGYGGSMIEPWMPPAAWARLDHGLQPGDPERGKPSILYNAMIHPLLGFTLKGFLWYQGESSALYPARYERVFPALISAWREAWGLGDLPFYFVQLAPGPDGVDGDATGEAWAWLREAQGKALSVKNTGMAVITDAGEYVDIHPQNKQPVGERLALLAEEELGLPVAAQSPRFVSAEFKDGKASLRFAQVGSGLTTARVAINRQPGLPWGEDPQAAIAEAGSLAGFTLCGADRKFYPATAEIKGQNLVEVDCPQVPQPVALRYGWANFPLCNLFNSAGLPASPFRTDDFPQPVFLGTKP